jgi:pyruvate/2-oxoglutarate dehydrogenase complex dihydrolipoamide dehydrogenase (E3) component
VLILGGGPVGVELGQFFRRFGAQVTIVQSAERPIDREDPAVGELIGGYLREEGIDVRVGATAEAAHRANGRRVLVLEGGEEIAAEELLIATGRRPRVDGIGLEIAAVGLTEHQARDRGIDVATSRVRLAEAIARPWTYEQDPRGDLGLIADRERRVLVGAWAVAPLAGEWIHQAALAIKTQTPIEVLRDTVAQFPTFSEAYLKGVEALDI